MKTNPQIVKILLFLTFVLLLCIVFDFLALTDIYHEYVSKFIMNKYSPGTLNVLPDFTKTALEWSIVRFSLLIKFAMITITFVLLYTSRSDLTQVKNNL